MALKPEKEIQHRAVDIRNNGGFSIFQSHGTSESRVSFNKTLFVTKMANDKKTFAWLDRGRPFENVHSGAVSGYTPRVFGVVDGCLDRRIWTWRVMQYCKIIKHELTRADEYDGTVPGSYYACHAEKQFMAYFLWMHTTVDRKFSGRYKNNKHSAEIWRSCNEIKDLEACKPDVTAMKKDIYISREPCFDCKRFQQQIFLKTRIFFNLSYVKQIVTNTLAV
jgi:hypothetical protein